MQRKRLNRKKLFKSSKEWMDIKAQKSREEENHTKLIQCRKCYQAGFAPEVGGVVLVGMTTEEEQR